MENFEPKPNRVKEKNLYIVHLDTPRIIILSSVVVGIIAASFLFGMSFFKDKNTQTKNLAINDIGINDKKENLFGKDMEGDVKISGDDLKIDENSELIGKENEKTDGTVKSTDVLKGSELAGSGTGTKGDEKVDVFTKENIKEIIPPASKSRNSVVKSEKKQASKPVAVKKADKKIKTAAVKVQPSKKEQAKKSTSQSKVVQVSKTTKVHTSGGSGFAVQVASYDRLDKAEREKGILKSRNFDAYVDRTIVNGKNFYRVKIGPVQSRDMAASLLNGVQRDSRYSNSYITRD